MKCAIHFPLLFLSTILKFLGQMDEFALGLVGTELLNLIICSLEGILLKAFTDSIRNISFIFFKRLLKIYFNGPNLSLNICTITVKLASTNMHK